VLAGIIIPRLPSRLLDHPISRIAAAIKHLRIKDTESLFRRIPSFRYRRFYFGEKSTNNSHNSSQRLPSFSPYGNPILSGAMSKSPDIRTDRHPSRSRSRLDDKKNRNTRAGRRRRGRPKADIDRWEGKRRLGRSRVLALKNNCHALTAQICRTTTTTVRSLTLRIEKRRNPPPGIKCWRDK